MESDPLQLAQMDCNWLESNLVSLSCDLPHDTITATIESVDHALSSFIEGFTNKVLFNKEPVEPTEDNAFITSVVPKLPTPLSQFLDELKKKTIDNISAYLDDRRSQDQTSVLNFKKKMLDSVTTCRLSAEQYRRTYDLAARHREQVTLANVEENNKVKMEQEMEKLSKTVHGKEFENSILSKQLQFLMIEREMLEGKLLAAAQVKARPLSGSPRQKKGKKGKHKKGKSRPTTVLPALMPTPGDLFESSPIIELPQAAQECKFCIEHQASVRNLQQEISILRWRLDHPAVPEAECPEDVKVNGYNPLHELEAQSHHHHKKHHHHGHHGHPKHHTSESSKDVHHNESTKMTTEEGRDSPSGHNGHPHHHPHHPHHHGHHAHGHHSGHGHHHDHHKHKHEHHDGTKSGKLAGDDEPVDDASAALISTKSNRSSKREATSTRDDEVLEPLTVIGNEFTSNIPVVEETMPIAESGKAVARQTSNPTNQTSSAVQAPSPLAKANSVSIQQSRKGQRSTVATMGNSSSNLLHGHSSSPKPATSAVKIAPVNSTDTNPTPVVQSTSSVPQDQPISGSDVPAVVLGAPAPELDQPDVVSSSSNAESLGNGKLVLEVNFERDSSITTGDQLNLGSNEQLPSAENTTNIVRQQDSEIPMASEALAAVGQQTASISEALSPNGVSPPMHSAPVVPPPVAKIESRTNSNVIPTANGSSPSPATTSFARTTSSSVKDRVQSPAQPNGNLKRVASLRTSTPTKQSKEVDQSRNGAIKKFKDKEGVENKESTFQRMPSNGAAEASSLTGILAAKKEMENLLPLSDANALDMTDSAEPTGRTSRFRDSSEPGTSYDVATADSISEAIAKASEQAAAAAAAAAAEETHKKLTEEFELKWLHQSRKMQEQELVIEQQKQQMEELLTKVVQSAPLHPVSAIQPPTVVDENASHDSNSLDVDTDRGSRTSLSIIERENIFKDQLLVEARDVQNELQTRLLSLEYQNAKLSKKLRSEEANQERSEALHKLQIEERDVLLKILTDQVKDLKSRLSRTEELLKLQIPPSIPVRENYISRMRSSGDLSPRKEVCSLPTIKWDTNNGFVQGRLHSRESRRRGNGLESESTPNLNATVAMQTSLLPPPQSSEDNLSPPRKIVGGATAAFKAITSTTGPQTTGPVAAAVTSKTNRKIDPVSVLKDSIDKVQGVLPQLEQSTAGLDLRNDVHQIRQQIASVLIANSSVEKKDPSLAGSKQAELKRKYREVPLKAT